MYVFTVLYSSKYQMCCILNGKNVLHMPMGHLFLTALKVSWAIQIQIMKEKIYCQKTFFYIANYHHKGLNLNFKMLFEIKATNLKHVKLKMEK